ncbi:MAG TPA: D-glycero-beta-D-manno-heptose 1-phosphate adenylyltransferase [Candidatus Omnitrophica bacterium]|nr:D-glycero-beta-D-manno-heptose 1-phosphate adenylyltransferase [Candidatus Omnitrophota bacterium]HBG64673.1 D-glycero-beta-D-manno-heptose 1-phosphate adenylyltransferase [Candidatus Omnitrophota bacterium]HCD39118.1 D-glycero-beta-D-manno-heptose 1-phosphate adenylyltransferase [Candidatus Omnitrophota bacterium]
MARSKISESKVKTQRQIKAIALALRKDNKKIAFTNGCFDILHYGHVMYLEAAKRLADILVVGLNSDSSVRNIKGSQRPLNPEFARARVLGALTCVDYVTVFSEETPLRLIKLIKPDVLIKGGDWKVSDIVGSDFVKARGGKAVTIAYLKGYSTTGIIKKMRDG